MGIGGDKFFSTLMGLMGRPIILKDYSREESDRGQPPVRLIP
jgi:hypothetical protein